MNHLTKLVLAALVLFSTFTFAQSKEVPMPVGGIKALMENVVYPEKAHEDGIQGKVILEVTVNESGNVIGTSVKKSAGSDLDNAAIEAVKKTKFTPAEKDGKKVKASVVIPFQFKLGEKEEK